MPSPMRAAVPTGSRGRSMKRLSYPLSDREGVGRGRSAGLLDEAGVDDAGDVGDGFDDADLEQQVGGFLGEGLQLAGEELLVRRFVLPAQVLGRVAELLSRLLHV